MADRTLSPLAVSALGILLEEPRHPYEVYRVMQRRREDRVVKLRPGTLYHAIDKLAEDGLLEVVGTDREGNRPERTTYAITTAGRDLLRATVRQMLSRPIYEYPTFPLAIGEAHALERDDAMAALTERTATLRDELAFIDDAIERILVPTVPPVLWLDLSYQRSQLVSEIDWLTHLIADIDNGTVDWAARTAGDGTGPLSDCFDVATPLFPHVPPRKAS